MEKQLNDLKRELTSFHDIEGKTSLNRRFSNIQSFIKIILERQNELERNTILINNYFIIKNELMNIINENEKDDKRFLECLNKQKIFKRNLLIMGRYVDVDVKESLKYLIGLFYLKWERLQNFVTQKKELSIKFKTEVEEYSLIFSNKKYGSLILLHDNILKLMNDIEIEIFIVEKVSFVPELDLICKNLKEMFTRMKCLITKIKKDIKRLREIGFEANEQRKIMDLENKQSDFYYSSLQNKNNLGGNNSKIDIFKCSDRLFISGWIKSIFAKKIYLWFFILIVILFLLFYSYTFGDYMGFCGCHLSELWIMKKRRKYVNLF